MRAFALAGLLVLGACALTPQEKADVQAACVIDGAIHPIALAVATALAPPYGAPADIAANILIQAYCNTLGGTAAAVPSTTVPAS